MRCYFAPMEGVTGWVFRQAHHRYFGGVKKYFLPFYSPTHDRNFTAREMRDLLPEHNAGLPAVPQVLTKVPEDLLWAVERFRDMGYTEVNLNLGCPSGTVVAKGKGSGMLADPESLDRFLDQVFSVRWTQISVKTRLGIRDPEEFYKILAVFDRYPICELTVHVRVQKDFYREKARGEWFRYAVEHTSLPLCYNGDLVSAADCAGFGRAYPDVPVMLGRGLVSDPALARKANGGPPADRESLRAFHDEVYHGYCADFGSARNAVSRMKELWFYLVSLFEVDPKLEKAMKRSASPSEYEGLADRILAESPLRRDAAPGWLIR